VKGGVPLDKIVSIFMNIFLILVICGCLEEPQNSVNSPITRPANATDADIIKAEAKAISSNDGPRGITLFLNKINKDGVTLDAKADEPSDFVDTILWFISWMVG
jgi:hypothetical protein